MGGFVYRLPHTPHRTLSEVNWPATAEWPNGFLPHFCLPHSPQLSCHCWWPLSRGRSKKEKKQRFCLSVVFPGVFCHADKLRVHQGSWRCTVGLFVVNSRLSERLRRGDPSGGRRLQRAAACPRSVLGGAASAGMGAAVASPRGCSGITFERHVGTIAAIPAMRLRDERWKNTSWTLVGGRCDPADPRHLAEPGEL
ncbi:hypothetical protein TraAM80_08780 [Trypanosoma rangeli]|uniref:Uncharacterized protein n=1 Tax=Trypanosoma rangeli TaxID=5698 RepID=A0A422MZ13_TRYRA|nr:uncharacterized protein TraAM80_08780 [Trypanosoma rangeli]RNE98462.1 hypothetical protein TraAM80_08780 [Trypanosoma rangeli]|eukprot:RNE98462.1 hypothetical protein TraAM80_08780 [Trypanosoma rangeli]